ncbi:hypothetical protein C5C90_07825 [Rathayibacter sp. AY1D4]|nr:hypothetical protein C5C35_16005 [Rathayibacter sp. AY1F8]PPH75387.1 hypothetical protein C5C90_07825 [Rathayibacter sp. AY1D4]PPH90474.1 hypothetical protein C5C64_07230 [Rathayibacter sp. AY1D3]
MLATDYGDFWMVAAARRGESATRVQELSHWASSATTLEQSREQSREQVGASCPAGGRRRA